VASFKLNAGGSLTLSSWADNATRCVIGVKAPSHFNVDSAPNIRVMRFFWQDNSSYEAGQNFEWRLQSSSAYTQESVLGLEYYEKEFEEENVYCARITNWWNGNNSIPEEQGSYSVGYSSEKCFVAMASPSPLIAEVINIGGSDAIKLTWQDSSTQETGFRVEVNTGSGWGSLATKSPNSTTHVHSSGLVAGTTYCYRVRAERTGSEASPWSNSACVRFGSSACSIIWDKDLSGGIGGSITTSAVIDDENIYVGTSTGYLISVDIMNGNIRWLKNLGSAVSSHLCASQEGQRTTIFVGTVDGKFHSVDSDGNLIGTRDLGGVVGGCAVKDGKVYLGTTTGWVFVLSKTLSILNSKQVSGAISTAPAIDAIRGSVYFVTESGKVYAFSLDLSDKWNITISGNPVIKSSPGLGPKGDIYFGANDGKLYKVSPSGSVVWSYNIGSAIRSSPVVHTYGSQVTVFVGADNNYVYAISENITGTSASLLWSYSTGSAVRSSGALSQKSVFIGSGSTLYSRSIGGGNLNCSVAVLGSITAPVKMKGQIVFLGTEGGRLYAISSVEPQSSYSWVDFGNGNGRVLDAHPYRGFAVEKSLWPVNVGAGILVSPKLYDFDGDGKLEIVVATGSGEVYVLNSTGTVRWSYSTGSVVWGSPAIGDIDGDGSADIVVANDGGQVYAFDSAGNVKTGFPISVTCKIRFLTLANIDDDSENEILFPTFEPCNRLYVYDYEDIDPKDDVADLKWYYQLSQRIRSHPVVNGSGASAEILIADVVGNLYKFDSSGNLISGWPINVGLSQWMSSPSVGDIDGDGVQDFVVGGGGTGPNKIYAYNLDGTLKWALVLPDENGSNLSGHYPRNIVLANIDGDSGLEVIVTVLPFNFGDPGYIYVIDDNGGMKWFKKFSSQPSLAPAVGDFDYDGSQEIVFTTDGGWLHIFDALSGEYKYGSPYFLGSGLRGPSPVFGDIDGNGRLELVFGDLSGYVRVFELGKQTINGKKEWYFRRNLRNNANYNE
jgi:outer membrane protein assembly factor BamB